MQVKSRWLLGLCGLALAVPGTVMADPPGDEPEPAAVGAQDQAPRPHHHLTWFSRRHCIECQRAYIKAHDGVDVPAPPALEANAMPAASMPAENCTVCQGNAVGSVVVSGPVMNGNGAAPGYAVVGPGAPAGPNAPGYAVVGGEVGMASTGFDPAPVGVYRGGLSPTGAPRTAAPARPAAGPYDSAVVPTNLPPAQEALAGPAGDRPHIISHLLGLPRFGAIQRQRDEKERAKHAAIAYDQPNQVVTELPASMVYGDSGKPAK